VPPVLVLVAVAAAVLLTFLAVKFVDYLRQTDAEKRAQEIISRAENEIATKLKQADLEIKERAIQQRGEVEKELAVARHELHERERQLDKRQDAIDQQAEQ